MLSCQKQMAPWSNQFLQRRTSWTRAHHPWVPGTETETNSRICSIVSANSNTLLITIVTVKISGR